MHDFAETVMLAFLMALLTGLIYLAAMVLANAQTCHTTCYWLAGTQYCDTTCD